MSELRPVPLSLLIRQSAKSYDRDRSVFGVHRRAMFRGVPGCDLRQAGPTGEIGAPLGIASGPQTQMARNIAAGYLAGARWFELKTVRRERHLPDRPTIFPGEALRHREWTHELPPRDALIEFAKGMYLIEALRALFIPENLTMGLEPYAFDLSVYPEAAPVTIEDSVPLHDRVRDMEPVWEALRHDLRAELPRDLAFLAEIPMPPSLARSVTLSLDHGPRFADVERTTDEWKSAGFEVRWKLPPVVLGEDRVRSLLETLGYGDWDIVPETGAKEPVNEDGVWHERLAEARAGGVRVAIGHGPHVGRPGEEPGYLSGRFLYPFGLAEALMLQTLGYECSDMAFAGGIEEANYPEAVMLGFGTVSLASDLFRPGGLARLGRLHRALGKVMRKEGADSLASYRSRSDRGALQSAFERALSDDRYHRRVPQRRDITSALSLFDCVNCDLCMPVCPNGANFSYAVEPESVVRGRFRFTRGAFAEIESAPLSIGVGKRPDQQIACEAELCNDCGLCEGVCPEEGAPQFEKPRIFRSRAAFERDARDGLLIERQYGVAVMRARFGASNYELRVDEAGETLFQDGGTFCAVSDDGVPTIVPGRLPGEGDEVDLVPWQRMLWILRAFLKREATTLAAVALEEDVW
ncbi:MAG: hypothetical protein HKN20_11065 [Gemmatimonadetes bacterium]|nr:hypothetical protein [Gemmatimonadota bacterium]